MIFFRLVFPFHANEVERNATKSNCYIDSQVFWFVNRWNKDKTNTDNYEQNRDENVDFDGSRPVGSAMKESKL